MSVLWMLLDVLRGDGARADFAVADVAEEMMLEDKALVDVFGGGDSHCWCHRQESSR